MVFSSTVQKYWPCHNWVNFYVSHVTKTYCNNFSDIDETMESVNKIDIHEGDGTTEATALWKILNDISTNWKLIILIFEASIL